MKYLATLILCLCITAAYSQRDFHWVFGDSAGIDFNTIPPTIDSTRSIVAIEPAASISDNNGNLLFYVGTPSGPGWSVAPEKYVVRDQNDSIMPGGDSLLGYYSCTQGLMILPNPYDTNQYYIFHIGRIYMQGIYLCYSIVDMSLNNNLGMVISSNNVLQDSVFEKMHAVKAANGVDWWVLTLGNYNTPAFYKFKLDSTGVNFHVTEPTLATILAGAGQLIFSPKGDKLLIVSTEVNYICDFDRCTGAITDQDTIDSNFSSDFRYGGSFSPNGKVVYISGMDNLWQYDLTAPNIAASKQLIFSVPNSAFTMGSHMLGPNGKIYIANISNSSGAPPIDSLNTHLTVINDPDSLGLACNIAPYSFSLNGNQSYGSLPNMVNYNLGKIEGLNCDSILALGMTDEIKQQHFNVFPNPAKNKISIKWSSITSKNLVLEIISADGQILQKQKLNPHEEHAELDINMPAGVYILRLQSDVDSAIKKLIVLE